MLPSESQKWGVRVIAEGPEHSRVRIRSHEFEVGGVLSFDAEYPRVSALETMLGAVGADLVGGLCRRARRKRLQFDNVEATVHGELHNPLVYLDVVGEEGNPGLRCINVKVYVSTLAAEAEVRQVWQEVLERSPLVQTLRRAVDLDISLKLTL